MSGPSPTVTVGNLVMGPGALYYGTYGATEPADGSINAAPASSAWTDVGGTMGGVKITVGMTFKELEVDQVVDVVGRRLVKREFTVETKLAEPTLANMQVVMNDTTFASGGNYQYIEPSNLTSATQPTYRAWLFDGWAPNTSQKRRRVILRRGLNTGNVEMESTKDNQTVLPVKIDGHYVSSSTAAFKVEDET